MPEKSKVVSLPATRRKVGGPERVPSRRDAPPARAGEQPVVLRVPLDLLERIDTTVKTRRLKTPRHTWLLEAVVEKLEREGA
jgi:hypothetical protein